MRKVVGFRGAGVTTLVALMAVAFAGDLRAQGMMVTGYADFEAQWTNLGGDSDSQFFFDNHHFNLVFLGNIIGDLFAAGEVEYEHAGEEIALEYAYFGYAGIRNFRILAGKFIIPFGRFNKDLHPSWINKMTDRPHGFRDIFPQTYSDVGLWLTGAFPLSAAGGSRLTYDIFGVNGLMGEDGGGIRGFRGNDRERQTNGRDKNKAVGGRLGLEFGPQGFDIGASVYTGNYSDDNDVDLNLTFFGADAAWRKSGFEIRAEFVTADQKATAEDLRKTGGYAQAAYLIKSRWEPVLRFSARNMPGESEDQNRLSFGLNFYVSAASAVRAVYHVNSEKSGFETDNNSFVLAWTISF
jgi:hypothetical protein